MITLAMILILLGSEKKHSVSFISNYHTPFPVQLAHTSLQTGIFLPYMVTKGSMILTGSI